MKSLREPVVGILDQNNFQLYKAPSYVPEGIVSFTCWQDMAKMMNQDTMDRIRFHILESKFCRPSASRNDAAVNLWITMTRDAKLLPGINLYDFYKIRVKDKLGNIKFQRHGPHELLRLAWRPGLKCPAVIETKIRNMPVRAKQIYQLLLEEDQEVLTYKQAIQVVSDNWHLIGSESTPGVLFSGYLRGIYYPLLMIKKMSFLDFCSSKNLKNIDLDMSSTNIQE